MGNIFIMGSGGFGTALAVMADSCGHNVTLWTPFEQEAGDLILHRENRKLLAGVGISERVKITTATDSLCEQNLVIIATPSSAVRQTARILADSRSDAVVACVSKGLESQSFKRLSEVLEDELPRGRIVMLSGPSHAEEVARGVPTTLVAASRYRDAAEFVQDTLISERFRIYASDDVTGVELGGALKNVIALAAGILDGLESGGDNTRAALMTRGIAEIARLGVAMGAKTETFAGLSGFGDLIVTCSSMHSRNRRCGILIGQGVPPEEAVRQIGMTVEGYPATKTAFELSRRIGITMPITAETYAVLYDGKSPSRAVADLMERPKRHESEAVWLLQR